MKQQLGARLIALVFQGMRDDTGQDLIEYGLLIGVITVASLLAITAIGGKVVPYFTNLNTAMP